MLPCCVLFYSTLQSNDPSLATHRLKSSQNVTYDFWTNYPVFPFHQSGMISVVLVICAYKNPLSKIWNGIFFSLFSYWFFTFLCTSRIYACNFFMYFNWLNYSKINSQDSALYPCNMLDFMVTLRVQNIVQENM